LYTLSCIEVDPDKLGLPKIHTFIGVQKSDHTTSWENFELLIYTGYVCDTCGFCGVSCTEFMDNWSAMNLVISGGSLSKPYKVWVWVTI